MMYRNRRARTGFTLIEVLVATAVTLLMMISLAQIFKIIGDSMQEGRATLELNNRLRNVALRVQHDLRNLALDEQAGYVEYFDGSQTDSTAALARPGGVRPVGASRYGDLDDILMFTAKAEDVWFTGKVPLYVLRGGFTAGLADNFEMVTIASEYAEIAVYAQPVVSNAAGNSSYDPAPLVIAPAAFLDLDGNAFPDDYNLHYRVLLIRPDLNVLNASVGQILPVGIHPTVGEAWLRAQPASAILPADTAGVALPTPLCDMARVHAQSDLSVRRVRAPATVDGLGAAADFIAANDLETLKDPSNRFAHVEIPVTGGRTLPLLALAAQVGTSAATPYFDFDGDGTDDMVDPTGAVGVGSGFLHPAFTMHTAWDAANTTSAFPSHQISASRVGEDILATGVRSFDVKCFDPGVPVVASLGSAALASPSDNLPGVTGVDDDGNGTVDDVAEIGWDGSDDEMLLPSDPGYVSAIFRLSNQPAAGTEAAVVSFGGYVDLGWARKLLSTFPAYGVTPGAAGGAFPTAPNLWSAFSGYSPRAWANAGGQPPQFTDELYRSGKVVQPWPGSPTVMQFTADTSDYNHLENNGTLEAMLAGRLGGVYMNEPSASAGVALFTSLGAAWPVWLTDSWRVLDGSPNNSNNATRDLSTDGLDNDTLGFADDQREREASPPFAQKLTGIRVSIRMEDSATRIVKQMSIGQGIPAH